MPHDMLCQLYNSLILPLLHASYNSFNKSLFFNKKTVLQVKVKIPVKLTKYFTSLSI